MGITFNTGNTLRKTPIKRNCKFFSDEDIDLEMEFASEYMEQDAGQTVILYQVDYEKTNVNDIYKEAEKDKIRFKTPVEITVVYDIQDAEMKAYRESVSKGVYAKPGRLVFSVLLKELEEKKCDIRRGDFIGVQINPEYIIYYTVSDDGRVQMTGNKNTLYGTKPYFRQISANYVDPVDFQG